MDGIQPYAAAPAPAPSTQPTARPVAAAPFPSNPASHKAPADYARALRRRFWLVLTVGVPLSVAASVWVVRQPSIYKASTQIVIEPLSYDPVLSTLVSKDLGRHEPEDNETFIPNRIARLKSKALAEQVVNDPAFLQGSTPPDSEAAELFSAAILARPVPKTNYVTVSLEGVDPARTAKQLSTLLELFERQARDERDNRNLNYKGFADEYLQKLKRELKEEIDAPIARVLKESKAIGPGGKNIYQGQFENLGVELAQKKFRLGDLQQQAWVAKVVPKFEFDPEEQSRKGEIADLHKTRRQLAERINQGQRLARRFESDPSVKTNVARLESVLQQIEELQRIPKKTAVDPSEMLVASMREEIHAVEEASKAKLDDLWRSMPQHELYLTLQDARTEKRRRISEMQTKISEFEMLSKDPKSPVTVFPVAEPVSPVRPKRALNIALGIVLSFGLGGALVCLLEYLDHSVKVPEHLTVGLTLPLLGVVPRIRRNALTNRGGHLWTPGVPQSVEADAYRNLRASLLGASDRLGPMVTLLVTSAKAGEGKSTTALNLAATCARAGERTLLMDVDLRRPSLAEVFEHEDGHDLGLVDVLRGDLPWQRTLVRTDIPNLDFLPTGDTREIPIEILGTLELRQLLIGLAGHYDRVILDGPAVLGLADCRMLGRAVDAAVLVVRSGSQEMRPLQRAKAMLEQSGVVLAGVVFNGLYEDLQNWSSYGPYDVFADPRTRADGRVGGLGTPDDDHAALPLA